MPKRAAWVVVLVLFLVALPYVFAAQAGGAEHTFGGFLLNPQDGNSYLAKMYQGWRGELRFTLPFSAEPGEGGYLFLFYIFLGHLGRWTNLSLVLIFHLARLLGALLMFLALGRFMTATITCQRWRLWSFTLASLGLGMGWLVFAFGVLTSDFWVAEAYPFLSAYANPHFPLGMALLLFIFTLPVELNQASPSRWLAGWWVGAAALFLSLLSPFGVVLALLVLGGVLVWEIISQVAAERGKSGSYPTFSDLFRHSAFVQILIQRLAWVLICGIPLLLYDLWIARVDPKLAAWDAQNLTLTPPAWDVLLALSPALLLALPGAWRVIRENQREARLLLVWAITAGVLMYAPLGLQRRFLMGVHVALAGLAGYGLNSLAAWFSERLACRVSVAALALSLFTPILILWVGLYGIQTRDPMLYLTPNETLALEWLKSNTPARALVLAAPESGLFIPAHTGRRVIYGHPYETVDAEFEKAQVTGFFSGEMSSPGDFLEQRGVEYIFYGPRERKLGPLPKGLHAWQVFSAGSPGDDVVIYQAESQK